MAKRVLVVSEYPYYRQLITVFLMALNYEVLVTSEVAAAALEASDERRAHVALVDVSRVRGARSSRSAPSQALASQVRAQLAEPSLVIAVYWDAASVAEQLASTNVTFREVPTGVTNVACKYG